VIRAIHTGMEICKASRSCKNDLGFFFSLSKWIQGRPRNVQASVFLEEERCNYSGIAWRRVAVELPPGQLIHQLFLAQRALPSVLGRSKYIDVDIALGKTGMLC
jgi:hypothetical protein